LNEAQEIIEKDDLKFQDLKLESGNNKTTKKSKITCLLFNLIFINTTRFIQTKISKIKNNPVGQERFGIEGLMWLQINIL